MNGASFTPAIARDPWRRHKFRHTTLYDAYLYFAVMNAAHDAVESRSGLGGLRVDDVALQAALLVHLLSALVVSLRNGSVGFYL